MGGWVGFWVGGWGWAWLVWRWVLLVVAVTCAQEKLLKKGEAGRDRFDQFQTPLQMVVFFLRGTPQNDGSPVNGCAFSEMVVFQSKSYVP